MKKECCNNSCENCEFKINVGLIGGAGYIAPRHFRAIKENNGVLTSFMDLNDSVGIIDSYFPNAKFFTSNEAYKNELINKKINGVPNKYVAVCSPNNMHYNNSAMVMEMDSNVICEKPIALQTSNLDNLLKIEKLTGNRCYNILQLRLHNDIVKLKQKIDSDPNKIHDVDLTYITSRGLWYMRSWKGDPNISGGIATNIGIHFFDMLVHIFGNVSRSTIHLNNSSTSSGYLELKNARIRWFLSIDSNYLPTEIVSKGQRTYRKILINDYSLEFSGGFDNLHTKSYEEIFKGNGFGLEDCRRSLEIVEAIRNSNNSTHGEKHPLNR